MNPLRAGILAVLATSPALADDVSGANDILCSTLETSVCFAGGQCIAVYPADLNVPQFIEIDVKAKRLATTAASGQNRATEARTVDRSEGRLLLQGMESSRAFSLFIDEASGEASFASAADGRGVVAFAACTPLAR